MLAAVNVLSVDAANHTPNMPLERAPACSQRGSDCCQDSQERCCNSGDIAAACRPSMTTLAASNGNNKRLKRALEVEEPAVKKQRHAASSAGVTGKNGISNTANASQPASNHVQHPYNWQAANMWYFPGMAAAYQMWAVQQQQNAWGNFVTPGFALNPPGSTAAAYSQQCIPQQPCSSATNAAPRLSDDAVSASSTVSSVSGRNVDQPDDLCQSNHLNQLSEGSGETGTNKNDNKVSCNFEEQQFQVCEKVQITQDEVSSKPTTTTRWQSVADVPLRLACARAVMDLLRTRCGGKVHNAQATLAAVRAVEVHLYRTAASCQQYTDPVTLPARVTAFVRQRATAIAAARACCTDEEVMQPCPSAALQHA